jgi:dipeptidyl aminopeptidase/acylaminoacyl peptidase
MRRLTTAFISLVVLLVFAPGVGAQQETSAKKQLTLERLYTYPRLAGTAPVKAQWSQDSHRVAFLWNDKGMPFRDLWVYDVPAGELKQVTQLEGPRDAWTETSADKDPKLRQHLPPDRGLSDFTWADDSATLAFSFRGELYLAWADGSRPALRLTRTEPEEGAPRFSPDSQKLAFNSEHELWVLDLKTGARTQLTQGSSEDILNAEASYPEADWKTLDWSLDGRWIAFLQTDRTGKRTRLIPNYAGVEVTVQKQRYSFAQDETSKIRLGLAPAGGGQVVWLTPLARQYYNDWQWSPDSTGIVINRAEENWKRRHLDVVDVTQAVKMGGTEQSAERQPGWVRTVYTETDDKWLCTDLCDAVEWSPDGERLLFMSERDGWNHLYLIDADEDEVNVQVGASREPADQKSLRQLTRGYWQVEAFPADSFGVPVDLRPRFSRDGRRVYFTATKEDPSTRHLYWVSTSGGEPYRLTDSVGYNAAAVSPDERTIALIYSSFSQPWELYVRLNAQGESWRAVTRSRLPEFDEYDWPQPRIVEFPGRDGKTVRALLFTPSQIAVSLRKTMAPAGARPAGPPPAARAPVVNFVHGAGYRQAVLNRWGGYYAPRFQFNQFLTQHGYAVIDVDYRGSSGYGRDWRTDVYLHLGGKDLDDELAAMDYLRYQDWVDADRAGIWGMSYGGFMTLMAMFQSPDTFKAGSAWSAVSDWANYDRHYTQQRLRTPEEEPEAYQRSSPIHHVAGLKNPLQIIHGMVDDNVHFQDAVQLVDALVSAGKPFDLLIYPESKHGWTRPEVWVHSTRATFEFFEKHLKAQ